MRHILLLLALVASPAFATDRILFNPETNGDLKIKANIAGTATDALTVTGSSGNVTVSKFLTTSSTSDNTSTGTVNNYALTSNTIRFIASTTMTLTGAVAQAEGTPLTIYNETGNPLTIAMNSGSSTAANRFQSGTNRSITVLNGGSTSFSYSAGRWTLTGADYEEGTPAIALSFSTPGTSSASFNGRRFVRHGREVCFAFDTDVTKGTGSGVLTFTGLPYTSTTFGQAIAITMTGNTTPAGKYISGRVDTNSTTVRPLYFGSGQTDITGAELASAFSVTVNSCYTTN